jgi:hypothetical protein
MLALILAILTKIFRGYPQSLRSNAGAPRLFRDIFFQIISNILFTNTTTKIVLLGVNYLFAGYFFKFILLCFEPFGVLETVIVFRCEHHNILQSPYITYHLRRQRNEDLHNLYSSLHIIRIIKSLRMRWGGNVSRMEGKIST